MLKYFNYKERGLLVLNPSGSLNQNLSISTIESGGQQGSNSSLTIWPLHIDFMHFLLICIYASKFLSNNRIQCPGMHDS